VINAWCLTSPHTVYSLRVFVFFSRQRDLSFCRWAWPGAEDAERMNHEWNE
jgi:hypothetical protein